MFAYLCDFNLVKFKEQELFQTTKDDLSLDACHEGGEESHLQE